MAVLGCEEWGQSGSSDAFLSDSLGDYSTVWRAGCYVTNILSLPPIFFTRNNLGFSVILSSLPGGMLIFSIGFFGARPRATQAYHSLGFQIPRPWQGLGGQQSEHGWAGR